MRWMEWALLGVLGGGAIFLSSYTAFAYLLVCALCQILEG